MIKTMQDRQPGLGTTGISGTLTLTKTGTTARTVTFPDAAITVARIDAAQTFTGTQTFAAITATGTVTVPNGTAGAPGIRLTSEASGLYRVDATTLGFAVAGTSEATLTTAGLLTVTGNLSATGGAIILGGKSTFNVYGGTTAAVGGISASGWENLEFYTCTSGGTSTKRGAFDNTGKLTLIGTSDGILTVAGKITAKAAVPGSFADLAAVQAYLASILT